MTIKPKTTHSIDTDALRAAILNRPPLIFDPIDMEHILQIDAQLAKRLTAQRLETQAEVHRVLADGATKAAALMR